MTKVHSIKFNVQSPDVILAASYTQFALGREVVRKGRLELVEFKTGMGPCGRWVGKVTCEINTATLTIVQTSFSKDMTAIAEERAQLQRQYLWPVSSIEAAHNGEGWLDRQRKAFARVAEIDKISKEDIKIETFIYQLEDVRGRIHAVHAEAEAKTLT